MRWRCILPTGNCSPALWLLVVFLPGILPPPDRPFPRPVITGVSPHLCVRGCVPVSPDVCQCCVPVSPALCKGYVPVSPAVSGLCHQLCQSCVTSCVSVLCPCVCPCVTNCVSGLCHCVTAMCQDCVPVLPALCQGCVPVSTAVCQGCVRDTAGVQEPLGGGIGAVLHALCCARSVVQSRIYKCLSSPCSFHISGSTG